MRIRGKNLHNFRKTLSTQIVFECLRGWLSYINGFFRLVPVSDAKQRKPGKYVPFNRLSEIDDLLMEAATNEHSPQIVELKYV